MISDLTIKKGKIMLSEYKKVEVPKIDFFSNI